MSPYYNPTVTQTFLIVGGTRLKFLNGTSLNTLNLVLQPMHRFVAPLLKGIHVSAQRKLLSALRTTDVRLN